MRAAVCHGKKDLRIDHLPDAPLAADEVRVAVAYGGICGSDMHYFHRGAVGDFALRQPMTLGHEISGRVVEWGSAVTGLSAGMKAALNPSRACRTCEYCIAGRSNLCSNMFFLGSAGRFPHVQGGFAQHLVLRRDQVIPVPEGTDLLQLSCAEPLSVGLHAVNRAGPLLGKKVLVSGSGPIGLLTARAAVLAGAAEVISTDIEDAPLRVAVGRFGVTRGINVASSPDWVDGFEQAGGYFDVALEASGAPDALLAVFRAMKRGGRIVQVGMLPPGMAQVPVNVLQSRELEFIGAFRAHDEFDLAVRQIVSGAIDVTPILSGTYRLDDAVAAFENAGDRRKVIKLHLALAEEGIPGMITRTAIFEGRIKPGMEERFFREIRERLVPLWHRFPHASNIRLRRIIASDDDALPIAMIQQIDYPSMQALAEAVASPVRAEARAVTMEIMQLFEGRFYHVMSEGNLAADGAEPAA